MQSRYFRVGDQLQMLFGNHELNTVNFAYGKPRVFFALLAMVTLFQYAEKLTDEQTVEAVRTNHEWKYALHLPLEYPGFDPDWLCRLRQYAMSSVMGMAIVQTIADRLNSTGAFDPFPPATELIPDICQFNSASELTKAMLVAVEAVAAQKNSELLDLPLSDLYDRYIRLSRSLHQIHSPVVVNQLLHELSIDSTNFLDEVQRKKADGISLLVEVQALEEIWEKRNGNQPDTQADRCQFHCFCQICQLKADSKHHP